MQNQNIENISCSSPSFINRFFTSYELDPFDQVEWNFVDATISNDKGEVVFMQEQVEVPASWSQMAINVVASKYLQGELGTPAREKGVRDLISRVVNTIAAWGSKDGYFSSVSERDCFAAELKYLLLNQYAAFNSPVWFNVGVHEHPQCSACFICSVEDSMSSLLELQRIEALLFKYGSGTGTNLSSIRSSREKLSGGGMPSGPVSFMKAFDAWAAIIKSGGKTRRAAKMHILNASHPDIIEFIRCKSNEEKKAWALIEGGFSGEFAATGGAYESISFQNANLSVRVDDNFMRAAANSERYATRSVTDGSVVENLDAGAVLKEISFGTWVCGDPGIQFDTTINSWHTCPNSGRINASNPCSEYMHLDNSACNLASLNLLKFIDNEGEFNSTAFAQAVKILVTAQDILIDNASYPTEEITQCARSFRQLGLGYANLGATLMRLGVPYDSESGHARAAAITALMTAEAYRTSALLAARKSPFLGYEKNSAAMLKVIKKHRDAARIINKEHGWQALTDFALSAWDDVVELGAKCGFRNSQTTVLAPTGTIAFMMDCDTTGIEPDIAVVKYKKLCDGGFLKLVNQSVAPALRRLGYEEQAIIKILRHIEENDTIENAPGLKAEDLAVFDCAFKARNGTRSIHHSAHLKMMAAAQPFLSGAISKTVNVPAETTVEEIFNIYMQAWQLGIKAVAIYRDGSKRTQPLNTSKAEKKQGSNPIRRRLSDERNALTHKFSVGGLEGYLTVGLYPDGSPGEIFLTVAKEGSTLSGMMDAFATAISIALQYGVPLAALVKKFTYVRFEPSGITQNRDIPLAQSVVDYVFRWLALRFLSAPERRALQLHLDKADESQDVKSLKSDGTSDIREELKKNDNSLAVTFENSLDAPPCLVCGSSLMVRQAGCYRCLNCGSQGGCG